MKRTLGFLLNIQKLYWVSIKKLYNHEYDIEPLVCYENSLNHKDLQFNFVFLHNFIIMHNLLVALLLVIYTPYPTLGQVISTQNVRISLK